MFDCSIANIMWKTYDKYMALYKLDSWIWVTLRPWRRSHPSQCIYITYIRLISQCTRHVQDVDGASVTCPTAVVYLFTAMAFTCAQQRRFRADEGSSCHHALAAIALTLLRTPGKLYRPIPLHLKL